MSAAERDVVERLRESHRNLEAVSGGRTLKSLYSDSADEIERLRSELAARGCP